MKISRLSERLVLFTDERSCHENVAVVWTSAGPVVVDAFGARDQFRCVQHHLEAQGHARPVLQIFTHWHADHVLGNQDLDEVRVLGHALTSLYIREHLPKVVRQSLVPQGLVPQSTRCFPPTETFEAETTFAIGDVCFSLVHAPGHTADSCLVLLPEWQTVFAGDNLVGPEVEFSFPPASPWDEAPGIDSLVQVYKYIRRLAPKIVIPGHGWVLPPAEMLALNEHRYKAVLKRTSEILVRTIQGYVNGEASLHEQVIRAWLSQAKTCVTVDEQETLKENISKVLNQFSRAFAQALLAGRE